MPRPLRPIALFNHERVNSVLCFTVSYFILSFIFYLYITPIHYSYCCAPSRRSVNTLFEVFGMIRPGIQTPVFRMRSRDYYSTALLLVYNQAKSRPVSRCGRDVMSNIFCFLGQRGHLIYVVQSIFAVAALRKKEKLIRHIL